MQTPPEDLLSALATTLRLQIGPQVADPFAKTQAFMAAVILEKLSGQLRAASGDALTATAERVNLVDELRAASVTGPGPAIDAALAALFDNGSDAHWNALVEAVYAERGILGEARFAELLARIREALRGRFNRALAYAS